MAYVAFCKQTAGGNYILF